MEYAIGTLIAFLTFLLGIFSGREAQRRTMHKEVENQVYELRKQVEVYDALNQMHSKQTEHSGDMN